MRAISVGVLVLCLSLPLSATLAGCEERTREGPRRDDGTQRELAALTPRVTAVEQRAATLQGNVLFLSQQDEQQRAQLAQLQQQLTQTQQTLAQTQQELAQTRQELAVTQQQVAGMQNQARSARRQVQGILQQQQPQ